MRSFAVLLIVLCLSAVPLAALDGPGQGAAADTVLAFCDFSRLSPGVFGAPAKPGFPEYHYVPLKFTDGWEIVNNRGPAEWKVLEVEGARVLDYLGYNSTEWTYRFTYPMLSYGDPLWRDYTVEARVTPFRKDDLCGVIFRYRDGRHYYLFAFGPGDTLSLRYRDGEKGFDQEGWRVLASKQIPVDPLKPCSMRVQAYGDLIRCFLDQNLVFDLKDSRYQGGKVGLFATVPFRFHQVSVTTTAREKAAYLERAARRRAELDSLQRANPTPVLWKRIRVSGFGAARALRLGDLDGDGRCDLLLVQNIPFFGGNYNLISCLTAIDLDGRLLWQTGTPDPENAYVTYDVAAQIHDLDGDGQNEVVFAQGQWIKVADGKTGVIKAAYPVPESKILPGETSWKEYAHYYRRDHLPFLNVDCFAFCDLRGNGKPLDVIVKDRHTRIWAYTNTFELLWTATANLGHYPYFYDFDRDGKDEVFIGYSCLDHDGRMIWNLDDRLQEHADGICAGDFVLDGSGDKVFISASDDGVVLLDINGRILKHHRVGHAQTPTMGQYRTDVPGLEYCNINYWGEPGMISIYDCRGNLLTDFELIHAGSPVLPVNWTGDGREYIMLSGNPVEGGMVDGWGRRVVLFPEDGHPDLAYQVHDLTGDPRDEIILWDPDWIYIYTQSDIFAGDSIYAPVRPPDYNESNYGPVVSWPAWKRQGR